MEEQGPWLHFFNAHVGTVSRDEAGTDLTISFEDQMQQYVRSYSCPSDLDDTKPEVSCFLPRSMRSYSVNT